MKDKTRVALIYLVIIAIVMIFLVATMIFVMGYSVSDLLLPLLIGGGIMAFAIWVSIRSVKQEYGKDWMKIGTKEWVEENVPEHLRGEFERRRKSLKIRLLRVIGVILLVSTFVVFFVTKNPLWTVILFILTFIVSLPVGNVATMRFPGNTRTFYWIFVVFMLIFCIGLLYVAIRYWPDFLRALGIH